MNSEYFLTSDRIGFRTWSLDDMDHAMQLWGNEDVTKYIGGPFTLAQVHSKLSLEKKILRQHKVQQWPIFNLKTNEFIGSCGLRPYKPNEGIFEIGAHIKKDLWQQGYALESAQSVIEYSFSNLKVNALFAGHNPEHHTSKRLLHKLGFKYTHDEYYEPTGLHHPSYILSK